jgi:hypothetical protein
VRYCNEAKSGGKGEAETARLHNELSGNDMQSAVPIRIDLMSKQQNSQELCLDRTVVRAIDI